VRKIDDAAILRRARQLCEEVGIAWDGLSAIAPDSRILNERGRRECLMRAREQLLKETAATAEIEELEALHAKRAAAELERWQEKIHEMRKAS
jgi:hypothetical protein